MTFYECLEEEACKRGYKDLTEFCMRAGISAYLQDRFKYNAVLRNDTKEKIAKALRTTQGFVNDLIAKASTDTPPAAEKISEVEEKKEEVKKLEKEVNTVNKQVNTVNAAIKKQEKRAANLAFTRTLTPTVIWRIHFI